jgi:hypothetical protein
MTIAEARDYRMPFGRHLEWIVGRPEYRNGLQTALKTFLGYPEIAKKVRKLHERDRR